MGYSASLLKNSTAVDGLSNWTSSGVWVANFGITQGHIFVLTGDAYMTQSVNLANLDFKPYAFKLTLTYRVDEAPLIQEPKIKARCRMTYYYSDGSMDEFIHPIGSITFPESLRPIGYPTWKKITIEPEREEDKTILSVRIYIEKEGTIGNLWVDNVDLRHLDNELLEREDKGKDFNSIITDDDGLHIYDGNAFEGAEKIITLGRHDKREEINLFGLKVKGPQSNHEVKLGQVDVYTEEEEKKIRYGLEIRGRNNVVMLDEYGIDPRFIKTFKNLIFNSSFERFDPVSKIPHFWTGGISTADSSFDNTRSMKLNPGETSEQTRTQGNYNPRANPAWWDNRPTRVSFFKKGGDVQVQVFSEYDYAPYPLRDEAGMMATYYNTRESNNWDVGRYTFSFEPLKSGRVWIRFSNIGIRAAYIDAVQMEPDFNGKYPSFYTNGPYSVSADEVPLSDTWLEYINIPYSQTISIQFNQRYTIPPTVTASLLRNILAGNVGSSFGSYNIVPNIDLIIEEENGFLFYTGAYITWGGSAPASIDNGYVSIQVVGRL